MTEGDSDFQPVFIRLRGRTQGPFDLDQLKALHQRGQFSRTHEISTDCQTWRSAATLELIFQAIKKPTVISIKKPEDELDSDFHAGPSVVAPQSRPIKPVWHYSVGTETYGPITLLELRSLVTHGQLRATDLVWKDGMPEWTPVAAMNELNATSVPSDKAPPIGTTQQTYCYACGSPTDPRAEICPKCGVRQPSHAAAGKNRMSAALLALFLGSIGTHRFYLGHVVLGLVYLFGLLIPAITAAILFYEDRTQLAQIFRGLSFVPTIASFIEAVVFLCMSDASFAARYNRR